MRSLRAIYYDLNYHQLGWIRTVLVSLNLNGRALGPIPHTRPRKHPDSIAGPFHQLVNYKLTRVRILYLDYRRLAVRPRFGHIENLVVGNHAVLLILRRGLPDYAQGGGRLRIGIHHLWWGPWHCGEGEKGWEGLWTMDNDKDTDTIDHQTDERDNTSCEMVRRRGIWGQFLCQIGR